MGSHLRYWLGLFATSVIVLAIITTVMASNYPYTYFYDNFDDGSNRFDAWGTFDGASPYVNVSGNIYFGHGSAPRAPDHTIIWWANKTVPKGAYLISFRAWQSYNDWGTFFKMAWMIRNTDIWSKSQKSAYNITVKQKIITMIPITLRWYYKYKASYDDDVTPCGIDEVNITALGNITDPINASEHITILYADNTVNWHNNGEYFTFNRYVSVGSKEKLLQWYFDGQGVLVVLTNDVSDTQTIELPNGTEIHLNNNTRFVTPNGGIYYVQIMSSEPGNYTFYDYNGWNLALAVYVLGPSPPPSPPSNNEDDGGENSTMAPPPSPPINTVLPSWSGMWIDNDTIMIRLTMSWGTAYKISVLDEDGEEIPFYASINGWYNGGNAEYTTATGHTLTIWRANITYNGSNYSGLQLKVDDSATTNLVLEAYPNEFYDYAIFLHLEGNYTKAIPVVSTAAIPQGGVLDWIVGGFRWLHDRLMGTPLKPVVQAWDTISGIGWAFYETGNTLLNMLWGIFTIIQKMLPYLSVGVFLAFAAIIITRPLDTIQMMMDIIDWIKKTIGSIIELVAAAIP